MLNAFRVQVQNPLFDKLIILNSILFFFPFWLKIFSGQFMRQSKLNSSPNDFKGHPNATNHIVNHF